MASSSNKLRRARPLLGTLVEITLAGDSPRHQEAAQQAFSEIERLHGLMSFHEEGSDVSRLNREACRGPVRVGADTWAVLSLAAGFARDSAGAFDITVGSTLQDWGFLSPPSSVQPVSGDYRSIELLPDNRVSFQAPVVIDLGGIAKGYAVDRAAAQLESLGIFEYVINAGGDLRLGRQAEVVHVRDPRQPGQMLALPPLANVAIATSASYFAGREVEGQWRHPLVVPGTRHPASGVGSVSVISRDCVTADALTKVVAVLGDRAMPVLAQYHSRALWIGEDGLCRELSAGGFDFGVVAS